MGDEAYDILRGFLVRTAGKMNCTTVKNKFNECLGGNDTQWMSKILQG